MKRFFQSIANYFRTSYDIEYAGISIADLLYDMRFWKTYTLQELLDALKEIEQIPKDTIIDQNAVVKILLESDHAPSLCFCACMVTKYEQIDEETIVTRLIELLNHEIEDVRRISARCLVVIDNLKGLNAVVGGHRHGHGIRTEVCWRIVEIGRDAQETIPGLMQLLHYTDINYRSHYAAASALASIGEPAKATLLAHLNSLNKNAQYYAAVALSELQPKPVNSPQIEEILKRGC